ncbi:hypothetical protein Tco_0293048 [Tanacetum coccineum]
MLMSRIFIPKEFAFFLSEVLGWTPEFFEEEEEDELSVEDKNDGRINDLEANNGIDESDVEEVLNKFGFGERWRTWIQSCLRSSRGSILVNGSPT